MSDKLRVEKSVSLGLSGDVGFSGGTTPAYSFGGGFCRTKVAC